MATKDGYYGSDDTSNTFMGNGTNWFTLVDKKLGDIAVSYTHLTLPTNREV